MPAAPLIALLLLAIAAPAVAQQKGAENAGEARAEKAKPSRKICKSDAELGTRIQHTTCLTAEEWRARDDATADAARRLVDRASIQGSAASAAAIGGGR